MEIIKLESDIREGSGKGFAHRLRANGRVPAILYGREMEPLSLEINEAAIRTVLHQHPESAVIDLDVKGDKSDETIHVIIRDVQRHPTTGNILHVDFQKIRFGEKIRVEVKIDVIGKPRGVKEQGGILEHSIRSVQIMCLPRKIPEALELDVSDLMIGDALKIADLVDKYPEIDILDEPDITVAGVSPPVVEEELVVAEVEEEEAEPELVAKEKEDQEKAEEKQEESS
jgi:large subunit ribosomal protein L25